MPLEIILRSQERGGDVQEARSVASCLLYFHAKMPIRVISKNVFDRDNHTFVSKALKRHRCIDIRIKFDREYKNKYDKIEKKLLKQPTDGA
jgi:hypothetical protein